MGGTERSMDQLPGFGHEVPAPGTALAEELDKKLLVQVPKILQITAWVNLKLCRV